MLTLCRWPLVSSKEWIQCCGKLAHIAIIAVLYIQILIFLVQVEDIIIPVEEVEDGGVEISVGVDGIMEDVTIA